MPRKQRAGSSDFIGKIAETPIIADQLFYTLPTNNIGSIQPFVEVYNTKTRSYHKESAEIVMMIKPRRRVNDKILRIFYEVDN